MADTKPLNDGRSGEGPAGPTERVEDSEPASIPSRPDRSSGSIDVTERVSAAQEPADPSDATVLPPSEAFRESETELTDDAVEYHDATDVSFLEKDARARLTSPAGGPAPAPAPSPGGRIGRPVPTGAASDPGTPPESLTGAFLLNRYRISERLGSGGFGSVYRAVDELKRSSGEPSELAIKVMDAAMLRGRVDVIIQEVSRSQDVSHPNVVRVHDVHVDGDLAFMTMEMLDGEPLSTRLERVARAVRSAGQPFLPIEEVDRIAEDLCSGLQHCHDRLLVHADIKPQNLFLCSDGTLKILDLGIAQIAGRRSEISGYSAKFASAQQMLGEAADPKDDVFSAGCVLYLCLTGELPFDRSSLEARRRGQRADTKKLPRRYRGAIAGALAFDRADRTATAAALWQRLSPAVRRRRAAFGVLALIVLAGVTGATLIGQEVGQQGTISSADRAVARERLEMAISIREDDPGRAASVLAEALALNPFLDEAAAQLDGVVEATLSADPAAYSLVWAGLESAFDAAPESDTLQGVVRRHTDRILAIDVADYSRSRVLRELRAPLCVLTPRSERADELRALSERLRISC